MEKKEKLDKLIKTSKEEALEEFSRRLRKIEKKLEKRYKKAQNYLRGDKTTKGKELYYGGELSCCNEGFLIIEELEIKKEMIGK